MATRNRKLCECSKVSYDQDAGCLPGHCISKHREIGDWLQERDTSHPKMEPIEDEFTTTPYHWWEDYEARKQRS